MVDLMAEYTPVKLTNKVLIMKELTCTFLGKDVNEYRVYWVIFKEYPLKRETKTMWFISDELGFERKVSKKSGLITGMKAGYATEFTE